MKYKTISQSGETKKRRLFISRGGVYNIERCGTMKADRVEDDELNEIFGMKD